MASTYEAIMTYTVPSAQSSYTFTSISQAYTDLVLVVSGSFGQNYAQVRFNGDSGSNYSRLRLTGNGSSATSYAGANNDAMLIDAPVSGVISNFIMNINNYSNSTTYKTALTRANDTTGFVEAIVNTWRNTSAVTSIYVGGNNILTGTTLTLYGIKAA